MSDPAPSTTTSDAPPVASQRQDHPGPPAVTEPQLEEKIEAVLRKVLPEFLNDRSAEPEPAAPAKPRSLRQEESDMEALVHKALAKLKADEPPAPVEPAVPVVETPPGPPPRKKRISTLLWGE